MPSEPILINRAPVLTLWAAVVAERLGYDRAAALTFGKAVAGLNAQAKGRSLGIYSPAKDGYGQAPSKTGLGEDFFLQLCGRPIPVKRTEAGLRAVVKDQPIEPEKVESYLRRSFGDRVDEAWSALATLAASVEPDQLDEVAYGLYEQFRPAIARGTAGWGQKGALDLEVVRKLAVR